MKEPTKNATEAEDRAKAKSTVDIADEDISSAIADAVEAFRGKADRAQVVSALRTQAELLNRDENWTK